MSDDTTVHYIPVPNRPFDAALCGVRWKWGSDNPKKITCPECIKKLLEAKQHAGN